MIDADYSQAVARVAENVARVWERIERAARASGRQRDAIRMVAVAKYLSAQQTRVLSSAGCVDLGENRPQQLWEKVEVLRDCSVRWHLIGHLQRNKVNRTLPLVDCVHSVDSVRLWQAIHDWAQAKQVAVDGFIEINISGDVSKHGFDPDTLPGALESLAGQCVPHDSQHANGLRVQGLMGMASREGGTQQAQHDFAKLRELRDAMAAQFPELSAWNELSMGMSGDFEQAIREGATIVRIGSALIDGVSLPWA